MANFQDCTSNFQPELCGVNVIVDPNAQTVQRDDRVLLIGQAGIASTVATGVHVLTDTLRAGIIAGSPLGQAIEEFEAVSPTAEFLVGVVPTVVGNAGSTELTFAIDAAATELGVVYLWVNGQLHQVSYDPADGDAALAAAVKASIDANGSNLVTVDLVGVGSISITTLTNGEVDGFLDVRTSYDRQPSRVTSSDVTITQNNTVAGAGVPDLSFLAATSEDFAFVISPYTDDTSRLSADEYACSQWSGGANSRVYGVHYGDDTAAILFAQNANSAFIDYMTIDGALTPPYVESASFGALAFNKLNCQASNLGASFTGTVMPSMLAPETGDTKTANQKAALVDAGIGYFNINRVGQVVVGRAVTTYTTSPSGASDTSLRDINVPAMIACISSRMRVQITERFTGYSFRADGVVGTANTGAPKVATVAAIRNFIISVAEQLSSENIIQDIPAFVASLNIIVPTDGGCITVETDPKLVVPFCCLNLTLRTT